MRIPARRRRADLGFNLTAMIDVVFNLIVFFLVASHFSKADSDDPVQLPTASQAANADNDPDRMTITVTAAGQWSVGGKAASLNEIETMIREGAER